MILVFLVFYSAIISQCNGFLQNLVRGLSDNIKQSVRVGAVDSLVNMTMFKLRQSERDLVEVDCVETMFMSPFHNPVTFAANSSLRVRHTVACQWNFVGTEPCIPQLTCEKFNLKESSNNGTCDEEYLQIFDGYQGVKKFCGKDGPINVTASGDLRDLYISFKGLKGIHDNSTIFSCSVICSSREKSQQHPLTANYQEKINPKCQCGEKMKDNRIVGGEEATKNEFPWLVALVEAKTRQPFCGGSIINDRFIITAGHCFKGRFLDINNVEVLVNAHVLDHTPNLFAVAGKPQPKRYDAKTLEELDSGNGSVRFTPKEIYVHPLYVAETNDFDVAGILLSVPINFEKLTLAHPVCLPEPGSYLRTFARRKAWIAGWGLQSLEALETPSILQKVQVNVFSASECKKFYAHRVNRRMMCAGYKNGAKDSCAGDSGGPLVVEDRDKVWYQIGSVSWGDGCAKEENPGVYFRTTESGQWLHYHSNENDAVWCQTP